MLNQLPHDRLSFGGGRMRTLATVQERILDRALFLIGTHGDDRVSVREITQAAGVDGNWKTTISVITAREERKSSSANI